MSKILVTPMPSSGIPPFEVEGELTYAIFPEDGKIYYIAGRSFPEKIVTVLEDETLEEKKMSCEHCQGRKPIPGSYGYGSDPELARIIDGEILTGGYNSEGSIVDISIYINFCPMCGDLLRNPKPLTLNELNERDGKPVWVVLRLSRLGTPLGSPEYEGWAIVNLHKHKIGFLIDANGDTHGVEGIDNLFDAYDYPPRKNV